MPAGFSVRRAPTSPVSAGTATRLELQCDAASAGTYSGTVSIASNDSTANPYSFTVTCQVNTPAPEIDVVGGDNLNSIASGDTTPSASDGTDFRSTTVGGNITNHFQIRNRGDAELTLGEVSVPAGFSVTRAPTSPVSAGTGTPLDLRCDAASAGMFSGTVSIASNDRTANPYTFTITCQVNTPAPGIEVVGGDNLNSIASGDGTPSVSDGTDFGTTTVGGNITNHFQIRNRGDAELTLGEVSVPAGFSVTRAPTSPVSAGTATQLDLRCDAASAGTFSGTVSIANNDSTANPYTFTVTCQVNTPAPQMDVAGGDLNSIASGDTTPSVSDGTDFRTTTVGGSITDVFVIHNIGDVDLTLGAVSVPAGFSVRRAPTSPVSAGTATQLDLRCDAASAGMFSGTVSIASNDSTANPYTFTVTCQVTGGAPKIDVQGNGTSIANGDTTPGARDGTDFGTTPVGTPVTQTFTILNTGTADLTLAVTDVPPGFLLTSAPSSPVTAGSSTTFAVQCPADAVQTHHGIVEHRQQ